MKKFSFPLDTVLNYKNQVLDSLKNEHGKILSEIINQEKTIDHLKNQFSACNRKFNECKISGITICHATGYQNYLGDVELKIQQEMQKLSVLKIREEKKRLEVVEAKKETSSIEKLKERKIEQYDKLVQKADELFIDEFVSNSRSVRCQRC